MIDLKTYLEFDPAKKMGPEGYERAQSVVTYMRQSSSLIVEADRARDNKSYLYGMQDMKEVKEMFKDWKKSGVKFWQLATMEKLANVLIAEEENTGIEFELKSTDATAVSDREKDMALLANRGWIDPTMTALNSLVGLPPFSMMQDKEIFKGNADQFDKMGLNSGNLQDLNYFFTQHYRLLHEMVGEEPVNYFIKYNELNEMIPMLMRDIISLKACAMRANVNDITGAIDYKYLAPENIRAIKGKRRDFKDATMISYEQGMSVTDMIKLIGNDFDYERDMLLLLRAVNVSSKTTFTGVMKDSMLYFGNRDGECCDYYKFLSLQVNVGYIEWKEVDASAYKYTIKNKAGQFGLRPTTIWGAQNPKSTYTRDVRYYETTYKAYYLAFGDYNQQLYKYGKLSYQMTEGAEDEYSNYSICVVQEPGKSAVEVAMPWIDFIEKNFKKLEYMVIRAKPPGRLLNYESLYDIAMTLFPGKDPNSAIDAVLKKFTESSNEMYTLPKINGQPTGGGTQVNFDIPHGLSKSVMEFKELLEWAFGKILDDLGISPMRSVYQPGERDGLGVQQSVNEYSIKATQYMHKMVTKVLMNLGKRTLSFTQDIIQFKDRSTVPYKFLEKALGSNTMDQLENMGNIQFHRYNIFVQGINTAADKQLQKQIAYQALQKGEIDYAQWLLINDISSPKKAMLVLAYEKLRKERVQAQQQQAQGQQQIDLENTQHQNKMAQINAEGGWGDRRENTRGMWYAKGQQIAADKEMELLKQKQEQAPELLRQKIEGDISSEEAQRNNQDQPATASAA